MTGDRDVRDPALDALMRTHSAETPPPSVDAAILAAAHRAVDSAPHARSGRATQPWRWWMPLAAAAVIGVVVVGTVPLAPSLVEPTQPVVSDTPANADMPGTASTSPTQSIQERRAPPTASTQQRDRVNAGAASAAPPVTPTPRQESERERATDSVESATLDKRSAAKTARENNEVTPAAPQQRRSRPEFEFYKITPAAPAPQLPMTSPSAATEPRSMPEQAPGKSDASTNSQRAAGTSSAAGAPTATTRADERMAVRQETSVPQPRSIDEWIARIRTLRAEARTSEAIRALADFRAAFSDADARLPGDLREWAKTVR